MKVVFSKRILKRELGTKPVQDDLNLVLKSFAKGIYISIGGKGMPPATSLIKIYATSVSGARRVVFMVDESSGEAFFLFFRTKNDSIGKNITMKNPEFTKALKEYLKCLFEDIGTGNYVEMNASDFGKL